MTPRLPWFRMHTEARNDAKLDALNDREHRIWFKLLCLAAEGEDRGAVDYIDPEFVAMELRVGVDELDSAISRMVRLRLLERSDSRLSFPAFAGRQYEKPSDRPEATRERKRVQRLRASAGGVTPMSRHVTPGVTPTEQSRFIKPIGLVDSVDSVDNHDPTLLSEVLSQLASGIQDPEQQ